MGRIAGVTQNPLQENKNVRPARNIYPYGTKIKDETKHVASKEGAKGDIKPPLDKPCR